MSCVSQILLHRHQDSDTDLTVDRSSGRDREKVRLLVLVRCVVVGRGHALLRVEQGLEDLARALNLVDGGVTLDKEVGDVCSHVDATRLQSLEELGGKVHTTERN